MRHPKGGPHYDGPLDEDTWVAISGYGPTKPLSSMAVSCSEGLDRRRDADIFRFQLKKGETTWQSDSLLTNSSKLVMLCME